MLSDFIDAGATIS